MSNLTSFYTQIKLFYSYKIFQLLSIMMLSSNIILYLNVN